jgi:hypothetical protein
MELYSGKWTYCDKCNRSFPSPSCFEQHVARGTCGTIWKCSKCNTNVKCARDKHECGGAAVNKCLHCGEDYGNKHVCYINSLEVSDTMGGRLIYFDFETTQYLGPHIVNLGVAMYSDSEEVFQFTTIGSFCRWLFRKEHNGVTAIAHNGKGYDFQFIRAWAMRKGLKVSWISNGMKIMTMTEKDSGVRLVDSLNFLPMSLAAFTKTFGLGGTVDGHVLKKGFFPHFFNTPRNVALYAGDVPALKYFGPSGMSVKNKAALVKWHAERQAVVTPTTPWVMKDELLEYCISDVRLLKAGCGMLRDLFMELTNCDPFQYVTIASTAMSVFRTNYLTDNVVVRDVPSRDTSVYACHRMEWLVYTATRKGLTLTEEINSGETGLVWARDVDGAKVSLHYMCDVDSANMELFERTYWNKKKKKQMHLVEAERLQAHTAAEVHGVLHTMWHSTWSEMRTHAVEVTNWLQDPINARAMPPMALSPRDAFFGGRTNAFKLQHKFDAAAGEYGCYVDVCSLYPAVNYYDAYPVGIPLKFKLRGNGEWTCTGRDGVVRSCEPPVLSETFGFVKCCVTCPTDLYHPVLPSRAEGGKGKLTFDLVSPKTGTWTSVEVNKAVQMGYVVEKVFETWHYQSSTSLFKGYVERFTKMKQEASGFPDDVVGDAEKEVAFCAAFHARMGISLDRASVAHNAGRRALAKLCLNSLWGKFGQRCNLLATKLVYTNAQLIKLLEDPRYDTSYIEPVTDLATEVGYRLKEEFTLSEMKVGCVNLPIAAFTTANGRLRLYEGLEELGEAVLYCDTDSIIYRVHPVLYPHVMATGEYLGEWTNELPAGCKLVNWFVGMAPKSYTYQYADAAGKVETVVKVKGFTLNVRNEGVINHESMRRVVQGMGGVKLKTRNPTRIKLRRNSQVPIIKVSEEKVMGFTYSKRFVLAGDINGTIDTVPFGHVRALESMPRHEVSVVEQPVEEEALTYDEQLEGEYVVDEDEDEDAQDAQDVGEDEDEGEGGCGLMERAPKRRRVRKGGRVGGLIEDEAGCDADDSEEEECDTMSVGEMEAQRAFICDDDEEHIDYYTARSQS